MKKASVKKKLSKKESKTKKKEILFIKIEAFIWKINIIHYFLIKDRDDSLNTANQLPQRLNMNPAQNY